MSLFVRKIEKAKWPEAGFLEKREIPADAITIDLKTKSNRLSVWEIESEKSIEDVVLAIVSAMDTIESIDIIVLDAGFLRDKGIECVQVDGKTPFEAQNKNNKELASLTYRTLGIIASHIADGVADKAKRYTEGRLKEMLREATLELGKFPLESLSLRLKEKILPRR